MAKAGTAGTSFVIASPFFINAVAGTIGRAPGCAVIVSAIFIFALPAVIGVIPINIAVIAGLMVVLIVAIVAIPAIIAVVAVIASAAGIIVAGIFGYASRAIPARFLIIITASITAGCGTQDAFYRRPFQTGISIIISANFP